MSTRYRTKTVIAEVDARQWADDTDPEELAEWCDGWTYTGTQHGHTTPHFTMHTCLNLEAAEGSPKGHVDPGDWIVRVGQDPDGWGLYEVLSPEEFAAKYEAFPISAEGQS